MSEIREKLEDLLYKSVINAEEIDITADKLFKSFHISEKLTNEEMEKINTIMCDFKTNFYGHGVEENAEYLEDIINKLTGVNNERSSNTTNRR